MLLALRQVYLDWIGAVERHPVRVHNGFASRRSDRHRVLTRAQPGKTVQPVRVGNGLDCLGTGLYFHGNVGWRLAGRNIGNLAPKA